MRERYGVLYHLVWWAVVAGYWLRDRFRKGME